MTARLRLCEKVVARSSSAYAPTHRACQADKDKFYADLQTVVDGVSAEDVLQIVGYLNARVGSGRIGGGR